MSRHGKTSGKGGGKDSLAGSLLLAQPSIRAGIFRHSVILLPAHDENGTMGVVLNRPLHKCVGEISSEFVTSALADVPVYQGGPVAADKLLFCAWRMDPQGAGFQLMFGIEPEKALAMRHKGMQLRAFYGYAGWDAGQLDKELRQDVWLVMPLLPHLISEDVEFNDTLWRKIVGGLGDRWKIYADEPDNFELN